MERLFSLFLIFMLLSTSVFAEGKVAVVQMMRGNVVASKDGKDINLKKGDWLEEGQVVKTQAKSFVKLVFIDKSSINVGPESEMVIEKFSKSEAGLLNLVKGKIRSQVSKDYLEMSQGQKSKLYMKSPGAVMGIRGTDFMFTYSEKTKASSAILFEGSVYFSKLGDRDRPEYKDLEKFVERDNIRIRPGEFSVAVKEAPSATIPAVLNVKQREILEKNVNFEQSARTPASKSGFSDGQKEVKAKTIVPPGLSGKIVANNNKELKKEVAAVVAKSASGRNPASQTHSTAPAPVKNALPVNAEGFIASNGAIKPANGSLMHIETGTIIAPPEDSSFDPQTNSYIPTEAAGTVSNAGEYVPPENIVYKEKTGEFIQVIDQNGQKVEVVVKPADMVMPSEPIAHVTGPAGTLDPVLAPPPPPPPTNDLYNSQFNPNGLNDYTNNNTNTGYNPIPGAIIRARVGFDFTIQ